MRHRIKGCQLGDLWARFAMICGPFDTSEKLKLGYLLNTKTEVDTKP